MKLKIATPKDPLPLPELPPVIAPDATLITESYPSIGNRIALMWGSNELQNYLNDLIFDERGDRAGFPVPIAAAILRIHREHSRLISDHDKNTWHKVTIL